MGPYLAEFIGTALLILFGNGVVANVVLSKTKGHGSGWIVITAGWGLAVTIAVYAVGSVSGAHLNPAVTVALAVVGKFDWSLVFGYICAQILGAFVGSLLVWLAYFPHWKATKDTLSKQAAFCTAPAIPCIFSNLLCEVIGTGALLFGVLSIPSFSDMVDSGWAVGFGPLLVGLIVFAIGLSLGGPTGYAINPARDLGPRIAHGLLSLSPKEKFGWKYAWIPVVGPILGGILGALLHGALCP